MMKNGRAAVLAALVSAAALLLRLFSPACFAAGMSSLADTYVLMKDGDKDVLTLRRVRPYAVDGGSLTAGCKYYWYRLDDAGAYISERGDLLIRSKATAISVDPAFAVSSASAVFYGGELPLTSDAPAFYTVTDAPDGIVEYMTIHDTKLISLISGEMILKDTAADHYENVE